MAWIEQRMAFSAERVRPGLNLPLPVTPFSSAANLPTATEHLLQTKQLLHKLHCGALRFAKPGKRGQEGGVGLFNRPNRLTQSTSALVVYTPFYYSAWVLFTRQEG